MKYTKNGYGINRSLFCYEVTCNVTGACVRYGLVNARSSQEAIGVGVRVARGRCLRNWTVIAHKVFGGEA